MAVQVLQLAAPTYYGLTDVHPDELGNYNIVGTGSTEDGASYNEILVVAGTGNAAGEGALLHNYHQPSLGNGNGGRKIFQGPDNRFYMVELTIVGNPNAIYIADSPDRGATWNSAIQIALPYAGNYTNGAQRSWRQDTRSGSPKNDSIMRIYYPAIDSGSTPRLGELVLNIGIGGPPPPPPPNSLSIVMRSGLGSFGYAAGNGDLNAARTTFWGGGVGGISGSPLVEGYVGSVRSGSNVQIYRYLVSFDLAAVPVGARISRA